MKDVEHESEACAGCHLPFCDPDLVVVTFGTEDVEARSPLGSYHLPCFVPLPGKRRAVVGLWYDQNTEAAVEPDLCRQVDGFSDYILARAVGVAEELEDDEIAARWPKVYALMSAQRGRSLGRDN